MVTENLVQLIQETAEHHRLNIAQRYWNGREWQDRTYWQLWQEVQSLAIGLQSLGIKTGDRVGLLSHTRPEWVIADFAVLCCGAVTVPIYPSVPADQVAYIAEDAGIQWIIVETEPLGEKVPKSIGQIVIDPSSDAHPSFGSLRKAGECPMPNCDRESLATLVYTSGTTGLPKGVMLTHGNILSNIEAVLDLARENPAMRVGTDDVALSFLPLSHILERMTHSYFLSQGVTIAYAESTDRLPENFLSIRPTIMVSVPRVFEKIHARILTQVSMYSPLKRQAFAWGVSTGQRRYQYLAAGKPVPTLIALQSRSLEHVVYDKVRAAVGGKLRFVISGGAPLAPEIGRFFFAVGILVLEGYGLTETSPVLAVNVPPVPQYGTVGRPLSNVTISIADDGEILARGPNITQGYWNLPEETKEALADGWFHTGDIGQLTEDGYLKVTDRKKYLIVLSTGKNVAPQAVEQKLALSPLIEQVVILGNRRKFISALLYLDPDRVGDWARQTFRSPNDYHALLESQPLKDYVWTEVEKMTANLAPFERPKAVRFLPAPLSEATGELTPSLKVKIRVVEDKYRDLIESMYAQDEERQAGLPEKQPRKS